MMMTDALTRRIGYRRHSPRITCGHDMYLLMGEIRGEGSTIWLLNEEGMAENVREITAGCERAIERQ